MGRKKLLVQDTHCDPGTILLLGTLDALATDFFLVPIAVWNRLTQQLLESADISRRYSRGTLRPLPSCPSAPVSQPNADTSLSSASLSQPWYSLLFGPSASGHHVWLAPDAMPRRRTRRGERCSLLSVEVETACDALRSIADGDGCIGPDICCHSYKPLYW
jgi:hypothetical protein